MKCCFNKLFNKEAMGSNKFFLKHALDALLNEHKIYKKEPTKLVVKGLL